MFLKAMVKLGVGPKECVIVEDSHHGRQAAFDAGAHLCAVENVEDVLHGAFAVFTAWGWASTEIVELVPGEKMIVRANDYYEADVASKYPGNKSPRMMAFMIRGVCGAFMDLAYGGDYDKSGEAGLYTFRCKQTKGIECGDQYGEFVVVKSEEYESM